MPLLAVHSSGGGFDQGMAFAASLATKGGRAFADGNDAVDSINGNCRITPVEVYETRFPWLIESLAFNVDSCGAGEYRGGVG